MYATLRDLVSDHDLQLRAVVRGSAEAQSLPVSWAHSSDLADPTPFLEAGQIVLTTGSQFSGATASEFEEYVGRLTAAGVAGIGFGTNVATATIPLDLVLSCDRGGLPLFEVPYTVPFIAVSRYIADRVASTQHARDTWALGAVRAVSFAALRPEGLETTLRELARQLARTVVLYDTHESRVATGSTHVVPDDLQDEVRAEALRLLGRGQRSSSSIARDGWMVSLQTIGRREELRGVLAVAGTVPLDTADQTVITSVVALAGLALEQSRRFARARDSLRSAAMQALLSGETALVRRILGQLGGVLPTEPVVVARMTSEHRDAVLDALLTLELSARAELFTAATDDGITVVGSAEMVARAAGQIAASHTAASGLSLSRPYVDIEIAVREADSALDATDAVHPVVAFSELSRRGVRWLLERDGARELAVAMLSPLVDAGEDRPGGLIESVRAWLEANGQWDPAARALGIHRHTLRARIAQAEHLLGRDLSTADARAELWFALKAQGVAVTH